MHTLSYLHTCPILLSAVIAAASKRLYDKQRHTRLWQHASRVVDDAIVQNKTHLCLMQSQLILAYSKDPSDTSAWRRVGTAIRMGFQLYFHVQRGVDLPGDGLARIILVSHGIGKVLR